MLRSWKIGSRLKLLMGVLLFMVATVIVMSVYYSVRTEDALNELYNDRLEALHELSVINEKILHNRFVST